MNVIVSSDSGMRNARDRIVEIAGDEVSQGLKRLIDDLHALVRELQAEVGPFRVTEFEVGIGVTAEGKVGLLGFGASAGLQSSFTVKFERD